MEFKLFGKSLFEIKKSKSEHVLQEGINKLKESKYLPDFYSSFGNTSGMGGILSSFAYTESALTPLTEAAAKKEEEKEKKKGITPKEAHNLKLLHDVVFRIKTDPEYVDQQVSNFKDKLALISDEDYDMRRGTAEISSVLSRMENRKKYAAFKEFYEEFPYTTNVKVAELVKEHPNLQLGQVAQFLADMPKEASDVMKKYNAKTKELCGKLAVFYIIADKKDFQKTEKRRDPILLAQSPFGHFWQILGAWDDEMLLVDEL